MAKNPTFMRTYGISIVAFLVWNHGNAGFNWGIIHAMQNEKYS